MDFHSQTYGLVNLKEISTIIMKEIKKSPMEEYIIAIGSDSQNTTRTKLVEVIVLQKVGKGGVFFYRITSFKPIRDLRRKLIAETEKTIGLGISFLEELENLYIEEGFDYQDYDLSLQIHCDVGKEGSSNQMVPMVVGYVKGVMMDCYEVKIKPYSFAASTVADKISK
ncbi:MAG: ribonuclease H-like YkuK family protein [Gallicola sp.]|nr:ribonuclease H-like YkuK family protein [Gallicola sp.]